MDPPPGKCNRFLVPIIGTAKEKDGNPVRIAFAWGALPDEKIAELWFITDLDDESGMDQANKIVSSLKAP